MADFLRIHPQVVDDLTAASRWYDQISIELGNRFRQAVNLRLDSIQARPTSYAKVFEDLRAARVSGFPYIIIFERVDMVTEIHGIFHAASDPQKWRGRSH